MGVFIAAFAFIATGLVMADPGENEHEMHQKKISNSAVTEFPEHSENSLPDKKSVTVANGDTVVVKSSGTDLSYDVTEIRAEAGSTLTIRYENTSNMPHNIVFVNERSDIQPVGIAGIQAREFDYIPQGEAIQEKIFGYTKLAKPGDTVYVTITVPPPGTYPYICTYPGHFTMMQGNLISQ